MMTEAKLPLPTEDGHQYAVIQAPDSPTIARIRQEAAQDKVYDAVYHLMRGSVVEIGGEKPGGAEIDRLPYKSAENLAIDVFSLIGIESKIAEVARCPQCGTDKEFYEDPDLGDRRIDIANLEVLQFEPGEDFKPRDTHFTIEPLSKAEARKKYHRLRGETEEAYEKRIAERCTLREVEGKSNGHDWFAEITSMEFRRATLYDMRETDRDSRTTEEFNRKLHARLAVDAEFTAEGIDIADFKDLKRKIGPSGGGIAGFRNHLYSDLIWHKLNEYGLQPHMLVECPNVRCRRDYRQWLSIIGFFGSALRSDFESVRAAG